MGNIKMIKETGELLSGMIALENAVRGGLIMTINAHGPITRETVNSATKRIIGAIRTAILNHQKTSNALTDTVLE